MRSISVVLPNYNGVGLLERNLPSLICALDGFEYEIIVVDDASSDESVSFVKVTYPEIIVVRHEKNKGFSGACNSGIFRSSKALICVSNTDVTFRQDYFQKIIPSIHGDVFAAKGRIRNETEEGTFLNFDTIARSHMKRGLWRFDKTVDDSETRDFSPELGGLFPLLGCCFVADGAKFKSLGGFDEIYSPFYWEDSDLPFRAMRAGYGLRYVPEAEVIHQVSATINRFRRKNFRKLISDRNKFLFTWRHMYSSRQWTSHLAFCTFSILARWLKLDWSYYLAIILALQKKFTRKGSEKISFID
jgi:GT2 family glycosyltransferase